MTAQQQLAKLIKAEAPGEARLSPFETRLHDEAAAAFVYDHGPARVNRRRPPQTNPGLTP